jgi:hypothetical protein
MGSDLNGNAEFRGTQVRNSSVSAVVFLNPKRITVLRISPFLQPCESFILPLCFEPFLSYPQLVNPTVSSIPPGLEDSVSLLWL